MASSQSAASPLAPLRASLTAKEVAASMYHSNTLLTAY